MTILAVDAGNSRVKWGLHDGNGWVCQGAVDNGQVERLADDWQRLAPPDAVVVSNVAGPAMKTALEEQLGHWPLAPHWVTANIRQCGVTNNYVDPAQLGPDRWAALIAARGMVPGACLVLNAGTAVTADALSRDGVFLGGIILPGVAMMGAALAWGTSGVRAEGGRFARFPTNTADAAHSGALQAIAGAAERMVRELEGQEGDCALVLSGGNARELAGLLNRPLTLVDNLVLEGLINIAREGVSQ